MATVVFINRLQPADGKRDALIGTDGRLISAQAHDS